MKLHKHSNQLGTNRPTLLHRTTYSSDRGSINKMNILRHLYSITYCIYYLFNPTLRKSPLLSKRYARLLYILYDKLNSPGNSRKSTNLSRQHREKKILRRLLTSSMHIFAVLANASPPWLPPNPASPAGTFMMVGRITSFHVKLAEYREQPCLDFHQIQTTTRARSCSPVRRGERAVSVRFGHARHKIVYIFLQTTRMRTLPTCQVHRKSVRSCRVEVNHLI